MTVESADFIGELDPNLPQDTDSISESAAHKRMIKRTIINSFEGTESDPWDTALRVGPRTLNSMAGVNTKDYVTVDTDQQINGEKYFTKPITAPALWSEAGSLVAEFSGASTVGNLDSPTWLLGRNDADMAVVWGPGAEGKFATLLNTSNVWRLLINTLYPVGSVIKQRSAQNPAGRFPGTGWVMVEEEAPWYNFERAE